MANVRFAGLCGLIHTDGELRAEIVLLDPRPFGGGVHDAWLIVPNLQADDLYPDQVILDHEGNATGLWSLTGATVSVMNSAVPFKIDRGAIGVQPSDPNEPAQWKSVRWLAEYIEPLTIANRATPPLSPRDLWSVQARVDVTSGALTAVIPGPGARTPNLKFSYGSSQSTDERCSSDVLDLALGNAATLVIRTATTVRSIPLAEGQTVIVSHTGVAGAPGHEDKAIQSLVVATQRVKQEHRPTVRIRPTRPDGCKAYVLLF